MDTSDQHFEFAVRPSFHSLSFSDEDPIELALNHVLKVRKKNDPNGTVLQTIEETVGRNTIGELRKLTDHEWHSLGIPAICRTYLKYCVRQSSKKMTSPRRSKTNSKNSFMVELQNDFNFGEPFRMEDFKEKLKIIANMGFSHDEAMEALCITENKTVDAALDILLTCDEQRKQQKRAEVVQRCGRMVKRAQSKISTNSPELQRQINTLTNQLKQSLSEKENLKSELKKYTDGISKMAYLEYLRGVTSDRSLSKKSFKKLQQYQMQQKISNHEHVKALKELGIKHQEFEEMKDFKLKQSQECVVCLEKPKTHVIFDCMHMCLCETCVVNFKRGQKCPMCSKRVVRTARIYT